MRLRATWWTRITRVVAGPSFRVVAPAEKRQAGPAMGAQAILGEIRLAVRVARSSVPVAKPQVVAAVGLSRLVVALVGLSRLEGAHLAVTRA